MPKDGLLYVKGMTISESEASTSEDIWDDTKLNEAYDKALRMANSEVAKRIAMSTNKQINKDSKTKNMPVPKATLGKNTHSKKEEVQWAAGMPCRTVFEEDGLEYEAFLLKIIDDKDCVVRFLGYDNSEIVPIKSLKRSLGKEERMLQIENACAENIEDGTSQRSETPNLEGMDIGSDQNSSVGNRGRQKYTKKRSSKNNRSNARNPGFTLPQMSFAMPNLESMKHLGSMDLPLPPPPPPMNFSSPDHADSEDQAVSSMLLSWYMSGYYTGLYQGLKRARKNPRND